MFRVPSDEMTSLVKLLVHNLTGFEEETPVFIACTDYILTNLQKAESLFFLKKTDIDVQIFGQADKFEFHGFKPQAEELRKNYARFIPESLPKSELHHKLMIMKFLICLSESPTKSFLENPDRGKVLVDESEEEIDWGVVLREGCEKWSPNYSSSSDEWSDDSTQIDSDTIQNTQFDEISRIKNDLDVSKHENEKLNYEEVCKKLSGLVQNGWFNRNGVQEVPETTNIDGNVAFSWDEFVRETTHGLLDQHSKIITEYKVMREIIWQLLIAHSSTCFDYDGKFVCAKENVTISSVRSVAFADFLSEFTKTINTLHSFRDFRNSFNENERYPGIYITYSECVKEILSPFMNEIVTIEDEIRKQDSKMTLLKLSHKLRNLSENVSILKRIHDEVIIDYKTNDPLKCATNLLSKLRYGLANNITSKIELDVYLTLYVGSLRRYLQIIYWWFNNDQLKDDYDEFIVGAQSDSESDLKLKSGYSVGSNSVFCLYSYESIDSDLDKNDSSRYFYKKDFDESLWDNFFGIISTKVVEIGNNIRFLRKLGKITLLNSKISSDIYEDFIERLLKKILIYFKIEIEVDLTPTESQHNPDFSAMCPDYVKYPLDLDKLENVVQKSNEFLMETFKPFFETKNLNLPSKKNLFQDIRGATKSVFPAEKFVDEAFEEILNERYGHSGYVIRDLFKSEYRIEEHFELLNHLYLLKDGLMTSWYQRLFKQMDETSKIESSIWLTGRLQDLLMDSFPVLHEKCFVKVSQGGLRGTPIQHALNACKLIEIEYEVDWPINVVIQDYDIEMYKEVFQFILEVKWALYTLTHMFFADIEPKVKIIKQHKAVTILLRRLKVSRFWLINQFSGILHYIFGGIITNASVKFERSLREACSLSTLSMAHRNFINDIHKSAITLKEYNSKSFGFSYLLYLVNKLKTMWNNLEKVEEQELSKLEKSYKICYKNLEKVMNSQIPEFLLN
nr:gamma-tubulin complex component 5-like [Onthophagus taurus]